MQIGVLAAGRWIGREREISDTNWLLIGQLGITLLRNICMRIVVIRLGTLVLLVEIMQGVLLLVLLIIGLLSVILGGVIVYFIHFLLDFSPAFAGLIS